MKSGLQIAIDGPVGSGKTDISAKLAQALGLVFIYTGAMYRALALICKQKGVSSKDSASVLSLLSDSLIDLVPPLEGDNRPYRVLVNGEDVTGLLFTPDIDIGASDVGVIPEVRKYMVKRQQELAQGKSVVMEGRDIGLRVLPNADIKIYLTADPYERAKRRLEQYKKAGKDMRLEDMIEDTKRRDEQDTSRVADPLQKLPDAWELDTTGITQEKVVALIIAELTKRNLV